MDFRQAFSSEGAQSKGVGFVTHVDPSDHQTTPVKSSPPKTMTEQTVDVETETVDIVAKLVCPHKGVAHALQSRAKQLQNTVYALKQYIHSLREASRISIRGHKAARAFLELPSSLIPEPYSPAQGASIENGLLANNGLRTLLDELASCDERIAERVQEIYHPNTAFLMPVQQLNKELEEVNCLLHKNRLGKSHRQHEDKVCNAAGDVNQAILSLQAACLAPYTLSPYCDPYTICRNTEHRMRTYLDMENEYAIQCLAEQKVEQHLEQNVFSIMQKVPLEHEKIMSLMMDECNSILVGAEEKVRSFHALSDWTAFENRNADDFTPETVRLITITMENHPDEEQFDQFQLIRLDDLEIYHKIKNQHYGKQVCQAGLEMKLRRARKLLTPARHGYACRGTWSVSTGGHLIEYEYKDRTVLSMFNLRKCKLGSLAPDEGSKLGYFVLRGRKEPDLSTKKKKRSKKEYKFRVEWERANVLYRILREYCTVASRKESKTEDRTGSTLSGDTVINIDGPRTLD